MFTPEHTAVTDEGKFDTDPPGAVSRIRRVQMLMAKCPWSDALVTGSSVAVY
jgi:hypothetical protein